MVWLRWFMVAVAVVALSGCADDAGSSGDSTDSVAEDLRARDYVPAETFFEEGGLDTWYDLTRRLKSDFDEVCPDTFCEGTYTNYESMAFRCSVSKKEGTIGSCVWVFAASEETVKESTGNVRVDTAFFKCKMPIPPNTKAADFVAALSQAPRAAEAPLPNGTKSLYDAVVDCL